MCAWFNRHFWDWYYIFFKCKISKQKKLSHQHLFYLDQPLKLCLRDGTITRKKTKCTVKVANMFEVTPTSRIKKTQVRSDFEAPLILLYVGNHKKDFVSSGQPCHPQEALVYKSIDEKFDILCSIFPNNDHRWHNFVIRLSL